MASDVMICNLALSNIGKKRINSLTEESAEARQCSLHYALARDALLSSHEWLWPREFKVLASKPNTWKQRWAFCYQRPGDCLKIIRVVPDVDPIPHDIALPHQVRGSLIFCNASPATLEYVARSKAEDPNAFPPLFVDALAWSLAARLAMPLSQEVKVAQNAMVMATNAANLAAAHDANEEVESYEHEAEALAARRV